jgi:hypothetical protein
MQVMGGAARAQVVSLAGARLLGGGATAQRLSGKRLNPGHFVSQEISHRVTADWFDCGSSNDAPPLCTARWCPLPIRS